MLNLDGIQRPNGERRENEKRSARPGRADWYPCVICGRRCNPATSKYVHLHGGGSVVVTEAEAAKMPSGEDLGGYPIGPECLKKHPEIKPYATYGA